MKSPYLKQVLSLRRRQSTVKKLIYLIENSKIKFSAIAFSGMSGALIAVPVADIMKKEIILVRKQDENTHSFAKVEYTRKLKNRNYIIVDDFVDTGNTVKNIILRLPKLLPKGIFTYNTRCNDKTEVWGVNIYG